LIEADKGVINRYLYFAGVFHRMRFLDAGSLRQFRHDGNLQEEVTLMDRFIEDIRNNLLNDVIS